MSKSTQPIPPGHENLIPHLVCDPCSKAIEFYKKAFGAEEVHRMVEPGGARIMHAARRIGNSFVFMHDDFPAAGDGQPNSPNTLRATPARCIDSTPGLAFSARVRIGAADSHRTSNAPIKLRDVPNSLHISAISAGHLFLNPSPIAGAVPCLPSIVARSPWSSCWLS